MELNEYVDECSQGGYGQGNDSHLGLCGMNYHGHASFLDGDVVMMIRMMMRMLGTGGSQYDEDSLILYYCSCCGYHWCCLSWRNQMD